MNTDVNGHDERGGVRVATGKARGGTAPAKANGTATGVCCALGTAASPSAGPRLPTAFVGARTAIRRAACGCRAVCVVQGLVWDEVVNKLTPYGAKTGRIFLENRIEVFLTFQETA